MEINQKVMKIAIISKTFFISDLINFYLRSLDKNIHILQIIPQNIISVDDEFDACILENSNLSGDITNLLKDIEMITNGMKNRIILINNERIFYRNNGYTIFPPNGSLDILDDLLPLHQIVKMPKPFRTTAGMEVREILRMPIPTMATKLRRLSPRQKLVFKLLLTELTNEQIAEELYIALSTLKNHVSNIYKTLELTSRTGLIKKYGYLLEELEQVQLAENQ